MDECLSETSANSLVIMLPIGAEGSAIKYAVQAIDAGLNVITSFRSLSIEDNISLKNLKDYPLISLGQETTTYDFYNKIFLKYGIELNPDTEVATTDQIIPLVKSDLGMAFVPEPMARESIEKNEIVEISLKEKIPNREVCIVHDCQHPLNSAARKLKNEICSC